MGSIFIHIDNNEFIVYSIPRKTRYVKYSKDIAIVEVFYSTLLVTGAFWLGACPFSLWLGRWILRKDIRDYGDGNPGATNVFRAGGRKSGYLAVVLDTAKGVPFVILAHSFFGFDVIITMLVALSAILGHAYSPLLRFRGGKSVAVTFGVLLALPQHEMLITFAGFMFLGFLLVEIDAWRVMFGPAGSLAYLTAIGSSQVELIFMSCVFLILLKKHFSDLKTIPRPRRGFIHWFQSRRREI